MSRSYKKSPYVTACKHKQGKRLANKRVRNTAWLSNGKGYKKVYESWDICDYKCRYNPKGEEWWSPLYRLRMK